MGCDSLGTRLCEEVAPAQGGLAHQSHQHCMASHAIGARHLSGQPGSPQQHAEGHCGFQHGKLVPHTLPRSTAKGDERKIAGNLIGVQAAALRLRSVACPPAIVVWVAIGFSEALWSEAVGVLPEIWRSAGIAAVRVPQPKGWPASLPLLDRPDHLTSHDAEPDFPLGLTHLTTLTSICAAVALHLRNPAE